MKNISRRFFDFFIFSSIYIGACAVLMVHQTNHLLKLQYETVHYSLFVFFSTICSYNFHWFLTPVIESELIRVRWTLQHKKLHLFLYIIGLLGAAWYFFYFTEHWFWMGIAILLSFLYSAPKLPLHPFGLLRKIAVGKTIFLAFVWMYVTTFLPIVFDGRPWLPADALFCCSRFFLIYSICILFDYRDRANDKKEGIRSLVTYLSEEGIHRLFGFSLLLFAASTATLYFTGMSITVILLLLLPGLITLSLYNVARKNFSDYLYYFVLDGLMMFSALFTSFISI
jgi:4-hydroxybenzoate polyprenyltransferase